ncbi:unnamed protein product, partial [Amoebophrya sp. A25]
GVAPTTASPPRDNKKIVGHQEDDPTEAALGSPKRVSFSVHGEETTTAIEGGPSTPTAVENAVALGARSP